MISLSLAEVYNYARCMPYDEFCSFVAKRIGNIQESECPKRFISNLELRQKECADERLTEQTDFTKHVLNCIMDEEEKLIRQVIEQLTNHEFTEDDLMLVEQGYVQGIQDWYFLRYNHQTLGKIIKRSTESGITITFEPNNWREKLIENEIENPLNNLQ